MNNNQDIVATEKDKWQLAGLAMVRIVVGMLMLYHGLEVFDAAKMKEYSAWEAFAHFPAPLFFVYVGKGAELVSGLLLALGLFTRLAAVIIIINMSYITFFIGRGRFWYEDQHPFLFVLLGFLFLFSGPVRWSIDQKRKTQNANH